ncbi:MAG TPA: protein kinase [Ktedonobacteraceae bacterium]|nr:protein kinase [Ktedonobacteraceae bacterium]
MPLVGSQLGRYRILRMLGKGAMGEVYLAEDTGIERQVAIKVIRTDTAYEQNGEAALEATRLFQREMRMIAKLNHTHILPLFDYGEAVVDGISLPYMVMPVCADGSLAMWLRQRGNAVSLPPSVVAHIVQQAADALQHAHDQQIIHRDIKPSNFLIRLPKDNPNRPDLLLSDFGLAKLSDTASSTSNHIVGTPLYMAPEQWRGHPVQATDQYMLAAMSYELLTGRPPFRGTLEQLMVQHIQGQPASPSTLNPQVSSTLDGVILRALAKRPEDRFPTISAFARAFQVAVQSTQTEQDSLYETMQSNDEKTAALADTSSPSVLSEEVQGTIRGKVPVPSADSPDVAERRGSNGTSLGDAVQGERSTTQGRGVSFSMQATKKGLSCNMALLLTVVLLIFGGLAVSNLIGYSFRANLSPGSSSAGGGAMPPATSTAIAAATAPAIATGTSVPTSLRPYPASNGQLVLSDPLHDNSKNYQWDEHAGCRFVGGAYDVQVSASNTSQPCYAHTSSFSNFTFEVQMRIVQGDCGSIVFRAESTTSSFYGFRICQDGHYSFIVHSGPYSRTIVDHVAPAIRTGLNQSNTLAVVAQGNTFDLYVNDEKVGSTSDSSYSRGEIGVLATNQAGNGTEAVFSNAKVWVTA